MKNDRQKKIIELVENRCIETQEQLLDQLRQCGFHSTQATVSRDIKELQIVKSLDGMGGYRYCLPHRVEGERFGARFRVIFRECVTNIDYAQNIIVIKTMPRRSCGREHRLAEDAEYGRLAVRRRYDACHHARQGICRGVLPRAAPHARVRSRHASPAAH